ncbi:MAG: cysteine--tRNA ligase, partial [Gammaproteobacteria bacterium]|nr:cysteine--tRNA ligase [Gammaproteobacteria bacterium]
ISVLFDLAREINRLKDHDSGKAASHAALLKKLGGALGLLQMDPKEYFTVELSAVITSASNMTATMTVTYGQEHIEQLIQKRNEARNSKSWKEADRIRDELAANGILIEDGASGTTWRRK